MNCEFKQFIHKNKHFFLLYQYKATFDVIDYILIMWPWPGIYIVYTHKSFLYATIIFFIYLSLDTDSKSITVCLNIPKTHILSISPNLFVAEYRLKFHQSVHTNFPIIVKMPSSPSGKMTSLNIVISPVWTMTCQVTEFYTKYWVPKTVFDSVNI